jgi:hypothetical protein
MMKLLLLEKLMRYFLHLVPSVLHALKSVVTVLAVCILQLLIALLLSVSRQQGDKSCSWHARLRSKRRLPDSIARLNYFMSVPKADTTVCTCVITYATVTADGADDSIRLSVLCETHQSSAMQWLPCCQSTSASELLHASDSAESEPEEDDDLAANGLAADANLSAAGGSLATNTKDEVMVDWNSAVNHGPIVADQQSATYLS